VPEDEQRRDEDHKERVDRELIELLNEVRVALPGVQVLFAFLLTLPFTQGFSKLSHRQEHIFVVALVLSALSAALLIGPTAHHRLSFRQGTKETLLRVSNVLVLLGLTALAFAVGCAVYLAVSLAEASEYAALLAAVVTAFTVLLWFVMPVVFLRNGRSTEPSR
jgi:hypothetical protein